MESGMLINRSSTRKATAAESKSIDHFPRTFFDRKTPARCRFTINSVSSVWRSVVMAYLFSSTYLLTFSVLALQSLPQDDAKYIRSPPKLEMESDREIWFHIPSTGTAIKFSLTCHASGDPEVYTWYKNDAEILVDGQRVMWDRPGQSGTITFLEPQPSDQGYYRCHVSNIFGTAVSNIFQVKMGVLDVFPKQSVKEVYVTEGDPLTLNCHLPHGEPKPTVVWLFRNTRQLNVIETVKRPHITTDGDGNLQFSHVEVHDGRENLVYQCAASSPVLQGLYRMGDEVRLNVTARAVSFRPPKLLYSSPEKVRVTAGDNLKLTCIFAGVPLPRVHWSRKGAPLPEVRTTDDDFGKTLIIKPVLVSDEGVYICQAGGGGVIQRHEITVEVTSAPQWSEGPPKNLELPEETDAELVCKAVGDPTPIVRWYMNGKPLHDTASNSRRTVVDNGEVLKISRVNHAVDRGVYQCNASNHLGYVFANAYINVLAQPPQFKTARDQILKTVIGRSVDLDCNVSAAPVPEIVWLKKTDQLERRVSFDGRKFQLLPNNTLRLHDLHLDDSGDFYCNVSNKYGANRARRIVHVYHPTRFLSGLDPGPKTTEPKEEVSMSCTAEADLNLEIEYVWWKDDKVIDFSGDHSIRRYEPNRIVIPSTKGKHSGTYRCVAKTDVDEVSSGLKLIVRDVPEAPIITGIDCTERAASVKWVAAFDNYDRIREYIVEYSTAFKPNEWKHSLTERKADVEKYEAIVNLSPWVNYTFRVLAVNSYGRGAPAYSQHTRCETPPSYPYINPANVVIDSDENETLGISWMPMDKEDWNGDHLRYIVRYWPDEPNPTVQSIEINDPWQNRMVVRELPIYKKYRAHVQAANAIGVSIAMPVNVTGYTAEGIPNEAPKNFAVSDHNSTAVRFQWSPVPPVSLNGYFQGYRVYSVRSDANVLDIALPAANISSDRTSAVVGHFRPMQEFEAKMTVFNSRGFEGPFSQTIRFTMPEGPSGNVSAFLAHPLGAKTILVTWDKPDEPQGIVQSYHVNYTRIDEAGRPRETYSALIKERNFHHIWNDHDGVFTPRPQTKYKVSIAAETGCQCLGAVSSQIVETYIEQAPSKPDLAVETIGYTSANVTWIFPKDGMPGTAFFVNYSLAEEESWEASENVYVPKRWIIIDRLTPNTEYKIYLIAKDGLYKTWSDMRIFRTVNVSMSEQTKSLMSGWTGAAWFIAVICAIVVALVSLLVICICQRNRGGKYPVKKKEQERGHMLEKDEERTFLEYQYGSGGGGITDSTVTN